MGGGEVHLGDWGSHVTGGWCVWGGGGREGTRLSHGIVIERLPSGDKERGTLGKERASVISTTETGKLL